MTRHFSIIGHPISHSLSPLLHNTAFEALGIDCHYEAMDIEPDQLDVTVAALKERGLSGFNVTIPHKQAVIPLLDQVDAAAKTIGAVNTVVAHERIFAGYNTDVNGFLKTVEPYQARIRGKDISVLGAGGAARAAVYVLLKHILPSSLTIINRTTERAEHLVNDLAGIQAECRLVTASFFDDHLQAMIDASAVIINTTSVGLKPYANASPLEEIELQKEQLVIDLIYTPLETKLLRTALDAGATAVGGLEMLLHQAAESFRMWTGKEMPLDIVRTKALDVLEEERKEG